MPTPAASAGQPAGAQVQPHQGRAAHSTARVASPRAHSALSAQHTADSCSKQAAAAALRRHLQREAKSAAAGALHELQLDAAAGAGGQGAAQAAPSSGAQTSGSASGRQGGASGRQGGATGGVCAGSEAGALADEAGAGASASSPDAFCARGCYDASKDIILRAEYISERDFRGIRVAVQATVLVSWAVLVMLVVLKLTQDDSWWFRTNFISYFNVVAASICLAAALACYAIFAHRMVATRRSGKRWSRRRQRRAMIRFFEATVLLINLASWLAPNAYILAGGCRWFSRFVIAMGAVQWTTWNTLFLAFVVEAHSTLPWRKRPGRTQESIMLDAPWVVLVGWPKLMLWCSQSGLVWRES